MADMLTAKEMQDLLQVDRSTIYRMAEAGRIPAIKVGKQWRFPTEQIESWFQLKIGSEAKQKNGGSEEKYGQPDDELAALLPIECVQLIQDTFAELLGVMLVITDLDGQPITRPSHACGLFQVISEQPEALQKCIDSWHDLGTALEIEPRFCQGHPGLLCARALIRVGHELKGMVVAGCVAPDQWPPSGEEVTEIAAVFGMPETMIADQLIKVFYLNDAQRNQVICSIQRIATIVAHIVNERQTLIGRLAAIADLTSI